MSRKKHKFTYRHAVLQDAKNIKSLLNTYAERKALLPRSLHFIIEHIRDYWVAVTDDDRLAGVCAFSVSQENLAEVKSLAIDEAFHRLGIARTLVNFGLKELKKLGVSRVFCLTYVPEFFVKMGFEEIKKDELPHKIWSDCINCPLFPDCDEIALSRNI